VVVKDGKVIASGAHVACGRDHAERAALKKAGPGARGATLYTTLEPCCHYGRTPPCTEAIIEAGIKRVVFLNRDPNPVACGGACVLTNAGIEVSALCNGNDAVEAARLNAPFFKYATEKLPFVTAKWAVSADGVMSVPGKSLWFTGDAARKDAHRLRSRVDAIITGVGTVLADDPLLDTRLIGGKYSPAKVVLDTRLRTPPTARLLSDARTIIVHGPGVSADGKKALAEKGAELAEVPLAGGGIDVSAAAEYLARAGIIHLLLEAGPRLQSAFMDAGLVDELVVYRAPVLVGPGDAPLSHARCAAPALRLLSTERFGDDIKQVYAVRPANHDRFLYRWEEKVLCSPE
jgi:diaminohydroxyphosphoribosylaminopyrimidine deaminase/5-amino-6-(5-phosphoribosylamino)uracil reductase